MKNAASNRDHYLAIKVLDDFKEGRAIPPEVCAELNQYPLIDTLRSQAGADSIESLLDQVETGGAEQASLALAILRPHAMTQSVRARVGAAWSAQITYERRFALLWLLLDDSELQESLRGSIKEFVRANLPRFLGEARRFFAAPADIIPAYRSRLADPTFPQSKKWIYLISACASDDEAAVQALLAQYAADADLEMRATAQEMLGRMFGKPRAA